jgi:hypothetical protein
MRYPEKPIREAAATIRPFLDHLVGQPEAAVLDSRLAELLCLDDREVDPEIRKTLSQYDKTRDWLQVFLDAGTILPAGRGYQPLPAPVSSIPGDKFICPKKNDYIWYRPFVGVPIPNCPTHKISLQRAP